MLSRHVLWALPDPSASLARWVRPAPGGRLVLVEELEHGAGLTAEQTERLVREHRSDATVQQLTDPVLWGRQIEDERYLLVSLA